MPNRTIYLPDEVDEIARRLDVNLSKVTQDAIRDLAASQQADRDERLKRARALAAKANITYPPNYLRDSREESGENLR